MKDNKVKISNILGSLIPDFIENDTTAGEESLFKQFLTQYYEFEEREYGTTDIAENIAFNKKISTLSKMETVRAQTIPAAGTIVPSEQIRVNGEVFSYDNLINVNHTKGFPEKYGLLKIDNEIITYTSKTDTSFVGCIRGFDGISQIKSTDDPQFLTFSETSATSHVTDSIVTNLGFNFLNEFYIKFKKNYLPGLENRTFTDGISVENILTRAKDFYTSKGTDLSLDILFKVLFGKHVIIDKPFNNTISPSDARWIRGKQVTVEAISGDPSQLKFSTLYQGTLAGFSTNSTAKGAIEKVETVFLKGSKRYFRLFLSPDTVKGNFNINSKTRVIAASPSSTVVTVDSTVGFGDTGSFSYKASNGQYVTTQYGSKSYNQFFDCVGLSTTLNKNTEIIDDNFVFSYEDNDPNKLCQMRLVGSISDITGNYQDTKFFSKDDVISLKHLGEKTSTTDLKYSSWIYNNIFRCNINSIDVVNKSIITKAPHYLKSGDRIFIDEASTLTTIDGNVEIDEILTPTKFSYKGSGVSNTLLTTPDLNLEYVFERKQDLVSDNLNLGHLIGDIQNTFVDSDKNTYVAFSGYPSYSNIETTDRSKEFTSAGIGTTALGITISNHGFLNGEKVYYQPIADQPIGPGITSTSSGVILGYIDDFGVLNKVQSVGIETGVYYVNVVDDNTIKLASNINNIFTDDNLWNYSKTDVGFTLFPVHSGINTSFKHKITPYNLYVGGSLKNQNNFRKIPKNSKLATSRKEIIGPIGVGVDGIEIYSPISNDSVYYGQLDKIDVLNVGGNYDVVTPPAVSIADTTGSSVDCNVHVNEGVLNEILLTSKGWDFSSTPSVTVTGGNGKGVSCDAKMREFVHSQSFNEFAVVTGGSTPGKIGIGTFHRFDDGEEVIYTVSSPGSPVGVGSTNADRSDAVTNSSPTTLINGGTYYIASQNNNEFSLAATKERALSKQKLIEFFDDGSGTHTITSNRKRKIIDRIVIHTKGHSFANNKVEVDSRKYPPETRAELSTTFVGINTYYDYIYAERHNFKEGDIVKYSASNSIIGGLIPKSEYFVSVVDNNKFKLADATTIDGVYENHILKLSTNELGRNITKFNDSPELISNGDFSGTTGWTVGTGWAISGGKATHTGTTAGYLTSTPLTPFIEGRWYVLTADVSAGSHFSMWNGFGIVGHHDTAYTQGNTSQYADVYTERVGDKLIALWRQGGAYLNSVNLYSSGTDVNGDTLNPTIDNVSIREVTTFGRTTIDYDKNIFVDLTSIGSGTHTFNYPDIKVSIEGVGAIGISSSHIPDYYYAKGDPVIRGQISNLFIKSGGVGFGVSSILNNIRKPDISLKTGIGANIGVIVDGSGTISDAFVSAGGTNYTSPPTLEVVGEGLFAQLKPTIVDGVITSVDVLNGGGRYDQESTTVNVVPTGESSNPAAFEPYVHEWKVNNVERYSNNLDYKIDAINSNKDTIQLQSEIIDKGNKLVSFYPNKQLRKNYDDNIESETNVEKTEDLIHSPVLGWAYDGNPIYGPYGFVNATPDAAGNFGGTRRMVSSYIKNEETNTGLRPSSYQSGFFIDDYQYVEGQGDLDEYNGRFEINDDYPNGIYAYYHTLEGNPTFPYVTYQHNNQTDEFNYDSFIDQSDKSINNGKYRRNVTFLGLNEANKEYPFLSDQIGSNVKVSIDAVKSSGLTTTFASNGGENYNVGDTISYSDTTVVNGSVREILGKDVNSIETSTTSISNLTFSIKGKNVEAFSTVPHNLLDSEVVTIDGVGSDNSLYTFVNGSYPIGVTTTVTTLSVGIANTLTTGITTFIQLAETTISDKFEVDDTIKINNEQMKILNKDHFNNRYRVARVNDGAGATGIAHNAGLVVTKLPQKFTFTLDNNKILNNNLEFSSKYNFDAESAVGIGSTVVDVEVGYAGSSVIKKSVPGGGIYLPGHKFKTNDKISYSVGSGSTVMYSVDTDIDGSGNLSAEGNLSDIGVQLYAIKLSDDFIGISSSLNGSRLYYVSVVGKNHRIETVVDNLYGLANKIDATIGLSTSHSLLVGDNINLNVTPNRIESHVLKYESAINDLVLDPVTIPSTDVLTSNSSFRGLTDHKYKTGDSVIFTTAGSAPSGLAPDKIYYVIKTSDNTIKLASSLYDAKAYPYNNIKFSSTGSGNHQLASVNLTIDVYKGNTLELDTSDVSLIDYDINFYHNEDFISPYDTELIQKYGVNGDGDAGTKIKINVTDEFLSGAYYRVEGNLSLIEDPKEHITSKIVVLNSKFNKNHRITGVGNTTLILNLVGAAETTSYSSDDISSAFYYTDSNNDTGPIYSINTINIDSTTILPKVVSVASTTGSKAIFVEQSDDIGEILATNILDQGFEFPTDNTLVPKADSYVVLKLQDIYTLDSIGITTGGKNYTTSPQVVAIGNTIIQTNSTILGNAVSEVDVITNDSGLSKNIEMISTVNSNGVGIINATTNLNTKELILELAAPINGWPNNQFPFTELDEIYVEGVKVLGGATTTADGYNSSDYNNQYFTIKDNGGINTTGGVFGNGTLTYSIAGLGTNGGTFDPDNVFGRVVNVDDLAKFEANLKKVSFSEGEVITQINSGATGVVVADGWNDNSQLLKLKNVVGEFINGEKIVGSITNEKSIVQDNYVFDFDLKVDSLISRSVDWETSKGKLNDHMQRIHDNDYYQRFSYAIKGEVAYENWKEPIGSLAHISGYKPFSDLEIINDPVANVGMSSAPADLILNVKVESEASVHERYNYDMATENTEDPDFSKIITFGSKIITDYSESRSNKVLLIDDISKKFTGVNNTFTGVHQFVRDELFNSTGAIAVIGGGNLGVTTAGTSYNPSTGVLTLTTSTAHGLNTNDEISLRNNSLTFTCDRDNFESEHPYPRSTDPASTSNSIFNNGVLKVTKIDNDTFTVLVNTPSIGGQTVGVSTFTLYTVDKQGVEPTGVSTDRLFYKTVIPSDGVNLTTDTITIEDHEFNTAEELIYSPHGSTSIQVDNGSGGNMNLPSRVFAINPGTDADRDRNRFKLASTAANAIAGTALTITTVGAGNTHTFAVTESVATNRTLISIDNMIQSPISFNKQITLGLSTDVGIGTTAIFLDDVSEVSGGKLLKIENELLKITGVGIGSTNILFVDRGFMGTTGAAHTIGAAITAVSGEYRIENGIIHFLEAPYEESTFTGRAYYRKDYTKNYIFDDISESFNGETREFIIKQNGTEVVGMKTEYGMILINNIFQDPEHGLGASNDYSSDYKVNTAGIGNSITFTGTYVGTQGYSADKKYLPKGGIINEFSVNPGVGLAPRFAAVANAVVGAGGTIESIGIVTNGSGYLSAPRVGIAITNYHFEHKFISAAANSITASNGASGTRTPTYATYNSTTGELILTIPAHGLTTSNKVTIANDTLTFQCSRDGYRSNKTYPRSGTDPVSGIATAITAKTDDTIAINVGRGAGVGAEFTATIGVGGTVTEITITDGGTGYDSAYPPIITIDEPEPWKNVPLGGGSGSGATMDVVVGTGGSAISYNLSNPGIGYSINDELELVEVPYTAGITTSPFKITVVNRHQDKFSGRTFGHLLELDDFSKYFNGFRRTFLITRTVTNKEYYSVNERDGSGIVLANNLLIFINDVLQQPVKDYKFTRGTKITFNEPPKADSKLRIYLYVASNIDFLGVNIDPTVKEGDVLKLQKWTNPINGNSSLEQDERIVYELISSDSVETQTYTGVGILTSANDFDRPLMWEKQTTDRIIDGVKVSKSRVELEPQFYPSTHIIKSVEKTDTKIYVRNTYPTFTTYDSITGNLNNISIVGLGTTALDTGSIERIGSVSYGGDYGKITGIKAVTTGGQDQLIFDITTHPDIQSAVTRPGIQTGDYFVVENSNIGSPSTNIANRVKAIGIDGSTVVGIGSTWIDGVYQAKTWTATGVGNTSIRVTTNVSALTGITTTDIPEPGDGETERFAGTYSWGYLNVTRNVATAKSFTFYNENGIAGIQTSAHISRTLQLKSEAST